MILKRFFQAHQQLKKLIMWKHRLMPTITTRWNMLSIFPSPLKEKLWVSLYLMLLCVYMIVISYYIGGSTHLLWHGYIWWDWEGCEGDIRFVDCWQNTSKVTMEAQLALIGGTMGLLTGFSILSGVEIIYYFLRFHFNIHMFKHWFLYTANSYEASVHYRLRWSFGDSEM